MVEDVKATRAAKKAAVKAAREKTKALKAEALLVARRARATSRSRRLTDAPVTPVQPEEVEPVMTYKQLTWNGADRLSISRIELLQKYYGKAIRSNVGDVTSMQRACWAVFHHSASTDSDPDHQFCPNGEESWCKC